MTLQLKPVGTFLWCFGLKIQNTQLVFEKSLGNSSYAQVANFGDTLSENAWRQLLRIWIRPKPISWRPVLHQKEWNLTKVLEQVNVLFFFQKRKKTNFGVCDHVISSLRLEPQVSLMFKFLSKISPKSWYAVEISFSKSWRWVIFEHFQH